MLLAPLWFGVDKPSEKRLKRILRPTAAQEDSGLANVHYDEKDSAISIARLVADGLHGGKADIVRNDQRLSASVRTGVEKIIGDAGGSLRGGITKNVLVLILLAAGKGSRFGQQPKCIQPVLGKPLARHSIEAFRSTFGGPSIAVVGYRHDEVSAALGADNVFVLSENPTGGTAFAAFEAFSVPELLEHNPLVVVTMGDRVVPASVFRQLVAKHTENDTEADLTFLSARYEPPKNEGKGRVLRDRTGKVVRIVEQKDIAAEADVLKHQALQSLTEGNCPLYLLRARRLFDLLGELDNANAQQQYYLTDIVARLHDSGREIRTITTVPTDADYDLLCSDVTRPADLALLEGVLAKQGEPAASIDDVAAATQAIREGRPVGQIASIARQLRTLLDEIPREKLGFAPDKPVAVGISGGRLRIAFMHPDMGRFFGPAWQMPIGAGDANGQEQIVVLAQDGDDGRVHLHPLDPKYRETINSVPADADAMYPGAEVADWHAYEGFGTRMSETLLLSLGYFSDEEIENRLRKNLPLPPNTVRVSSSMRRPFALVANALASMRTLREGTLGAKVQSRLDREHFTGLWIVCTGGIPQGGFSSSSALTVATKNALNALYGFGIPPDLLVHLACQAEYGTGVRAGSLDQATEQKGRAGQGTLISSNPADNYRILGTYTVPSDRFRVIFPYSVARDRTAWQWSWGTYGESAAQPGALTAAETRKMTGKAAEIAALLVQLPLDTSFFKEIETELLSRGELGIERRRWICNILRQLPLLISREELQQRTRSQHTWYVEALLSAGYVDRDAADKKAEVNIASLFSGWREPVLRRRTPSGATVTETGVPLRAMLAYLFGEVAKNFYLIHHPEEWIRFVTLSQRGDRSISIEAANLPDASAMEGEFDWERDLTGPARLNLWLTRHNAAPYDFNAGLGDENLSDEAPPDFHLWAGGSFFRGLALIDLVEAMLHRAFGDNAVALRVNAAGQGDFFQVHIDTRMVETEHVKRFLRNAFYRRFGIFPEPEFVETHTGGGAIGISLKNLNSLRRLVAMLEENA